MKRVRRGVCMMAIGLAFVAAASGRAYANSPPGPPIVFFDWDSIRIEREAALILDNAAVTLGRTMATRMAVGAATDRSGSDSYNRELSRRRGEAVRAYLISRGVPETAVSVEAYGETKLLVETADGMREPQNRYALVIYLIE